MEKKKSFAGKNLSELVRKNREMVRLNEERISLNEAVDSALREIRMDREYLFMVDDSNMSVN